MIGSDRRSDRGTRVCRRRYLLQMIFDLFKDGVSFESLQIAACAGENGTNLGADGARRREEKDCKSGLQMSACLMNTGETSSCVRGGA